MLNSQDAASALEKVSAAERQSHRAYSYSQSAPFCFVWGTAWFLGYGGEAFAPSYTTWAWVGWSWMAVSMAGTVLSIVIGRIQAKRNGQSAGRMGGLFFILFLLTTALFAIFRPESQIQVGAYFPLLFAAVYCAFGLWKGLRYILVGAFMALATLVAFFYLRDHFFLWMALVGGGSLFLTGYWMRQA